MTLSTEEFDWFVTNAVIELYATDREKIVHLCRETESWYNILSDLTVVSKTFEKSDEDYFLPINCAEGVAMYFNIRKDRAEDTTFRLETLSATVLSLKNEVESKYQDIANNITLGLWGCEQIPLEGNFAIPLDEQLHLQAYQVLNGKDYSMELNGSRVIPFDGRLDSSLNGEQAVVVRSGSSEDVPTILDVACMDVLDSLRMQSDPDYFKKINN